MRPIPAVLSVILVLTISLAVVRAEDDEDLRKRPHPLRPSERGIGSLIADLAFHDLDGKPGRLSDYGKKKALVIAFTNVGCPVCKRYGPRLARLAATWQAEDVAFLFVNPSPQDEPAEIRATLKAHGLSGRYVHDTARQITKALGATTTAEVFVLDAARTLVYRGAVDDQHGVGYVLEAPDRRHLERALNAVVNGRAPTIAATTAPGCVLRLEGASPKTTSITWHKHIARIVQRRCESCHRDGESAPFALSTYAQVQGNAGMISWVVKERVMPPWFAGPESLPFHNDRSLTALERAQFLEWIQADCPEGDAKHAPLPRTWVKSWRIGKPDVVLQIPKAFTVPAEGVVDYQYSQIKTAFGEDRWVKAFEIRPTAPQVVHHVLVFVRYPKDHPRAHEQPRARGGVDGYFAAMVPGQGAHTFPEGTARFLPKGSTLRFQVHYTTNGRAARDRTKLGLIFAPNRPVHEMRSTGIHNTRLSIPPGVANHRQAASRVVPVQGRIYSFTPHMHLRGKAFRYEAVFPDGRRTVLLDIPRYDFNWQMGYELAEPFDVPAGTRLHATAWYDNSENNPANPDPSKTVRWGEQTSDEMLIGYVDWHPLPRAK